MNFYTIISKIRMTTMVNNNDDDDPTNFDINDISR